jgi:hypothetical protein
VSVVLDNLAAGLTADEIIRVCFISVGVRLRTRFVNLRDDR